MARTVFAPAHRLAAGIRYIPAGDSAWNHDILNKAWEPGKEHEGHSLDPLHDYLMGDTRYDLGAQPLQDLIRATGLLDQQAAEVWTLRVLPFEQRVFVDDMIKRGERVKAHVYAFCHGVMKLEGASGEAGDKLAKCVEDLPSRRMSSDIDRLCALVGDYCFGVMEEIGAAVIVASRDLSEAEKKS